MNLLIRFLVLLILIFYGLSSVVRSQSPSLNLSGYLQNLNTLWIKDVTSQWYSMNSVVNRLNLKLYLNNQWNVNAAARNALTYGQLIYLNHPYYADLLIGDEGRLNLTTVIRQDSSYIFYSHLDRLNLHFVRDRFELTLGRQRINWGINLVWNPNDLFNTFNFYDFDYAERPGCDALRLQYYTGYASSFQAALKIDSENQLTAAFLYKFNYRNYDLQLLSGVMKEDAVIGAGWSGYLRDAGFSGEVSWFRNFEHITDSSGVIVLSMAVNYTFSNALFVHTAMLYNSAGTTGKAGWGDSFLTLQDLSPKTFTPARYALFGQMTYPISPLIRADFSTVFNPTDHSLFLGPALDFSLSDNIAFLLMGQIFRGKAGTEFGDYGTLIYTRLKWSF